MKIRVLAAAALLLSISAPSFAADAEMYIRHHHRHAQSAENIYLHNYGPPDFYPGTTVPPDRVVIR